MKVARTPTRISVVGALVATMLGATLVAAPAQAGDVPVGPMRALTPKAAGMPGQWVRSPAPCFIATRCVEYQAQRPGTANETYYVFQAQRFRTQQQARTVMAALMSASTVDRVRNTVVQGVRVVVNADSESRVIFAKYQNRIIFITVVGIHVSPPGINRWMQLAAEKALPSGGVLPPANIAAGP